MKLATIAGPHRDGRLVVVSTDLTQMIAVPAIAGTLLDAVERWDETEPALRDISERLGRGDLSGVQAFDPLVVRSPLPRTWQWLDGSVYTNHARLMERALHPDRPLPQDDVPLVYQGASDDFIGPTDDIVVNDESDGIDFEGEVAVVVDEVAMRSTATDAEQHIKLIMLVNDVSLRAYAGRELARGFGFLNAKPSSAFSPVAVTPDELGDRWHDGAVHLPLHVTWNGQWFGHPDAGAMTYDFRTVIEHVSRTRRLRSGTIIGSGTVSNDDPSVGSACIAERRAIEMIANGSPVTPFMSFGDRVRIEMLDPAGRSIFGAIDQRVTAAKR